MFRCLPDPAWADGNFAGQAGQVGKMVEHRNQSQPNPGLRAHGTPCNCEGKKRARLNVLTTIVRPLVFSPPSLFQCLQQWPTHVTG